MYHSMPTHGWTRLAIPFCDKRKSYVSFRQGGHLILEKGHDTSLAPECPDVITYSATNQTYVSSQEERRQLMPEVEVGEHPRSQVPSQMNTHAAAQGQASLSSEAEDDELDLPSSPRTPTPEILNQKIAPPPDR